MGAALVFGAADALQLRLQSYAAIPQEVWLAVALVGLAYLVVTRLPGRAGRRPPGRPGGPARPVSVVGTAVTVGVVIAAVVLYAIEPEWQFPPQFWLALPYVFALMALAGVVGNTRMPSALATAYRRASDV
jgi:ABC-type uncharacterized transport system permease subunit